VKFKASIRELISWNQQSSRYFTLSNKRRKYSLMK